MIKSITKLSKLVKLVSKIEYDSNNILVFRGEKRDYKKTALFPAVYRDKYIAKEDVIYRESQRFNDYEFSTDKTAFDKLSRIQHYSAPTRLIDVSEDLFSAIYFAIGDGSLEEEKNNEDVDTNKDNSDSIIYVFEIDHKKIKYYDSDAVSVISNLAKIPLTSRINRKSKQALLCDISLHRNKLKRFNKQRSAKFLLHEIKEDKPQFEPIIDPKHLTSVQFVLPKLTNNRVRTQKGAFLLFGLNPDNHEKPIKLLNENGELQVDEYIDHPIVNIHTFRLSYSHIEKMQKELNNLGIKAPFIFPEIDKVAGYLKNRYNGGNTIVDK